ncbi:MAG: recombinase family protein, partial [Oscillospiraceae bacterium]|nr:recombinase family protein [Oscillospiraceae bacterium]
MKNKMKCYLYTRVSTSMQVDGYSLDAQKDKLRKYAEYQYMTVVREYSDEGKSGKNINGRPEFLKMLRDIEEGKDGVSFVLVFKLFRFGRNAADVLTSFQRMQDFGVNRICVEDGIDSSKDSGKLMISVLSAVAEIERENILVQTMEGRKQKAREGKWNGGFAPYGYKLENGKLLVAEDEAEVIRVIFDKYIHTTMGVSKIAQWLNTHEYKKKKRQNNTLDAFSASFVKGGLDNPVYCGKLAYGRRHNEKIQGTRNQYHIVKQEEYMLHDGAHEAIVSEMDWQMAHQKRAINGVKQEKTHSLEHEH